MSEFKKKLLHKYLSNEILNEFESKKFEQYLGKINILTYCRYEEEQHLLNPDYIEWCKIKIKKLNKENSEKELYRKYNNVVVSTSRTSKIKNNLDANKESKT